MLQTDVPGKRYGGYVTFWNHLSESEAHEVVREIERRYPAGVDLGCAKQLGLDQRRPSDTLRAPSYIPEMSNDPGNDGTSLVELSSFKGVETIKLTKGAHTYPQRSELKKAWETERAARKLLN